VGKSRGRCKSSTMDSTLVDSLNNERVTMGMRQCHTAILQCATQSRVIGWSQAIDTFLFVFGNSMPRIFLILFLRSGAEILKLTELHCH
jgi:hypothetical protein